MTGTGASFKQLKLPDQEHVMEVNNGNSFPFHRERSFLADSTMKYMPKPIDTKDIELSEEVMGLAELLAENTHEVWAAQRVKDGWRYGEVRDDKNKLHPGLVSYEELPEGEKVYDRNTSLETLKVILKLGYEITRK